MRTVCIIPVCYGMVAFLIETCSCQNSLMLIELFLFLFNILFTTPLLKSFDVWCTACIITRNYRNQPNLPTSSAVVWTNHIIMKNCRHQQDKPYRKSMDMCQMLHYRRRCFKSRYQDKPDRID